MKNTSSEGKFMEKKTTPTAKELLFKSANNYIQAESEQPNKATGTLFTYFGQKKSISARETLTRELRNFLHTCGDFTFKFNENMEQYPSFNHYVVKLEEALDKYMLSIKKPKENIVFSYRRLKKAIAKYLKAPIISKETTSTTSNKEDREMND